MRCPVCGTEDEKLIRTCQLRGVIRACLGTRPNENLPMKVRHEDERIIDE
jgi:hypothetical protein